MLKFAIFLWMLFFMLLGFSMMPGTMTFVMIGSAIGGFIDGWQKIKKQNKKNKNRRLNMTLDADAWNF